jgi:hypothetical protein
MLTAIFRIGTITLALIWDLGYVIIVILPVSLAAPFIFLLLLKFVTCLPCCTSRLADLGVADIARAVVGELTGIAL